MACVHVWYYDCCTYLGVFRVESGLFGSKLTSKLFTTSGGGCWRLHIQMLSKPMRSSSLILLWHFPAHEARDASYTLSRVCRRRCLGTVPQVRSFSKAWLHPRLTHRVNMPTTLNLQLSSALIAGAAYLLKGAKVLFCAVL